MKSKIQQQEQELERMRQKERLFETVFDKVPIDIFIKDPSDDFRYIYCNQSFIETQGSGAPVVGKTDYEVFKDPKDATYLRNHDQKVLDEGQRRIYEESYTNKEGSTSIILVFKEPLHLNDYPKPLLLGTSLDLSCVPSINQLLLQKFADMDQATKNQTLKMANLRHEIRTLLNAIVGFTNLLNDSQMQLSEAERENFLHLVNTNTELLQSIINEILSKPQTQEASKAHLTQFDLDTLMKDVYTIYQSRLKGTSVAFCYETQGESPQLLQDEAQQMQVLYNLLNNAIKYTQQGSITMGYRVLSPHRVRIYVKDTGIGIAPENAEKIFNRFEKLGSSVEGYGLGLSIVKSITEAAGGTCGVESEVGKGSCFWVELPTQ
ncbi:MAG: ATP-binding protein [Alistipes sp.]|nr:ATP-binding protein [Alistipes sp.]